MCGEASPGNGDGDGDGIGGGGIRFLTRDSNEAMAETSFFSLSFFHPNIPSHLSGVITNFRLGSPPKPFGDHF